ncbi:putative uncharacterized protein [Burkholderiales bacterium GJ-E10]|nr:putative uncharacterized protein [Burkholderiales bacterium GJ-E10]
MFVCTPVHTQAAAADCAYNTATIVSSPIILRSRPERFMAAILPQWSLALRDMPQIRRAGERSRSCPWFDRPATGLSGDAAFQRNRYAGGSLPICSRSFSKVAPKSASRMP